MQNIGVLLDFSDLRHICHSKVMWPSPVPYEAYASDVFFNCNNVNQMDILCFKAGFFFHLTAGRILCWRYTWFFVTNVRRVLCFHHSFQEIRKAESKWIRCKQIVCLPFPTSSINICVAWYIYMHWSSIDANFAVTIVLVNLLPKCHSLLKWTCS